jgi:dihydroorotate dehydrogenase
MPELSPEVSLLHDSLMHVRGMIDQVGDVWRHEGLKRGVEHGMYAVGNLAAGRWLLEQIAGEGAHYSDTAMQTNVGGLELDSPFGIAAGWDKTGKSILAWQALGADHITVGGVTLFRQPGNAMPRLRTFDRQVGDHGNSRSLNSFGFYSPGSSEVVYNIARQRDTGEVTIPVTGQVTLNKEFYKEANRHLIPGIIAETTRKLMPVVDGINLGLSSPNTIGMRDSQGREFTYANIMAAKEVIGDEMPLGYKGDGDGGTERLDMYCEVALQTGLSYLELINTTAIPEIKARYGAADLMGGLAGADPEYQRMAAEAVAYVYTAIGDKVDVMGMGGVNSLAQAERLIRAGASGVGVNTAVRELGAKVMVKLKTELSDSIGTNPGPVSVRDMIGSDTERGVKLAA